MVGADVLGGPRTRGVPVGVFVDVFVGAARRGRRALPWVRACRWVWTWRWVRTWCWVWACRWVRTWCWCGRGRRPRRPACSRCLMGVSWAFSWVRRAEDVAPYHGYGHGVGRGHGVGCGHGVGRRHGVGVVGGDVPAARVPDVSPWTCPWAFSWARTCRWIRTWCWVWTWRWMW